MPEASTLALFSLAAIALLVVPGPAVVYIVTRSVDQGRAAGLVSVVGIHVGTLVHVAAAAVGLSALLVSSATAYMVVKWAGGAYLILLGLRRLWAGRAGHERAAPPWSLRRTFHQGVVVNVLNPKTALFFFAFLPQFIDPGVGPVAVQAVVLGALFVALGIASDGTYALTAAAVAGRLRRSPRVARLVERASGAVYVGLGAVALTGHRPATATSQ